MINTMRVRRALAKPLRRTAERLSPSHLQSLEVTHKRNRAPYVEINYLGGRRVAGFVHPTPDGPLAAAVDEMTSAPGMDAAAQAGIDLANRAIREVGRIAAEAGPPLKPHPTKPGHCACGQRLNMHSMAYCEPDKDDDNQRVTDAVQSGEHASEGAARRAFGLNPEDGLPPISAELRARLEAGFAGASPALPNVVNNVTIVRPTRRWWQFWKRANV